VKDKTYSLTSQIRRCAISIPSSMAEAYGRNSTAGYIHSLYIAKDSLYARLRLL